MSRIATPSAFGDADLLDLVPLIPEIVADVPCSRLAPQSPIIEMQTALEAAPVRLAAGLQSAACFSGFQVGVANTSCHRSFRSWPCPTHVQNTVVDPLCTSIERLVRFFSDYSGKVDTCGRPRTAYLHPERCDARTSRGERGRPAQVVAAHPGEKRASSARFRQSFGLRPTTLADAQKGPHQTEISTKPTPCYSVSNSRFAASPRGDRKINVFRLRHAVAMGQGGGEDIHSDGVDVSTSLNEKENGNG